MVIIPASCFLLPFNNNIGLSFQFGMLDSVQHVWVISKHLHSLQADFADRQAQGDISVTCYEHACRCTLEFFLCLTDRCKKNSNGHPHAHSKWYYIISSSGAEALTACGCQVAFELYHILGWEQRSGTLTVIFLSQPPPVLP